MSIKKYSNGSWNSIPYHKYGTETDSITTLPTPVIGDGTNATAVIEGNMQQATTPTPTNPVYPSETGERTGNLLNVNRTYSDTFTLDSSKWYIGAATQTVAQPSYATVTIQNNAVTVEASTNGFGACFIIPALPQAQYYISFNVNKQSSGSYFAYAYLNSNGEILSNSTKTATSATFNTPANTAYINICLRFPAADGEVTFSNIMIVEGSTAPSSYIPYGYKLPILSGGTTTPVYLGQVQSTRKIKKLVLTGEESIELNTVDKNRLMIQAVYTLPQSGTTTATNIICTHLVTLSSGSSTALQQGIAMRYNGTDMLFGVPFSLVGATTDDTNATIRTKVKAYLADQYAAGTPITVWYVLATPQTTTLNEPIRKIGDYADTVTTTTIPTTSTESTFDVDTTLKPSKVELTYHGWHPHSDVKYESGD